MATVYLCIGTMKTGTSAIQAFMRNNKKALAEQGYCYPKIKKWGRNTVNRNAYFLVYEPLSEQDPSVQSVWEEGMQEIEKLSKEYENIVLSDEIIWHHSGKKEHFWERVRDAFEQIGCEVKIVVYLRRQDELVQSLWNQNVKSERRWNIKFDDFIEKRKYRYFPLNYYKRLNEIAKVMGKENIIVRVYEKQQYEGGSLISDYATTLGIQLNEQFRMMHVVNNLSLKGNFVELRRMINGVPAYKSMPDYLHDTLTKVSSEKIEEGTEAKMSFFDYEEQVAFMKKYESSNEKVAREFLGREDGRLFYSPVEKRKKYQPDNKEMLEDFIHFSVVYMCQQEQKIEALEKKLADDLQKKDSGLAKKAYRKLKRMVKK